MTRDRADDRRDFQDDDVPGPHAVPPRVFVWGDARAEPGLFQKVLARFRRAAPRVRSSDRGRADLPPAVFRPPVTRRTPSGTPAAPTASGPSTPSLERPAVDGWEPPDLTVDPEPVEAAAPERSGAGTTAPAVEVAGHGPGPIHRATLQLLPGRLRPLDPDIVREEIRFVRPSGRDAVVTLGWAEGEPPDHITVNHPSVHELHARMTFIDRIWRIESLVERNPVLVNGEAVPVGTPPRELQSGDEVRLGDASFDFVMP
ncbi:MAG: FHA domain-containing protein [Gemmatimonadetes bacterium]|nr:FHA domain-containing protein [Gemmatimonadota bacterium]MBT8403843.1 FHA domain-containing protein [Gemmatimonadota bacterium]NNF38061.1 FHA domain-containing protein [Gemmatimonadota bacterium]